MAGDPKYTAAVYLDARPKYPTDWFSRLAALTPDHSLAWDVGTGTGQAATGIAEHYKQVIATDINEDLLKHGIQHPQVRYVHTPTSMSSDEMVELIGGENSVDLITVATALHYFDLENFYSIAKRVLKKPGGVIAVWTYNLVSVSDEFDSLMKNLFEKTRPFFKTKAMLAFECYRTIPFPFEGVGMGCEGQPVELDMPKDMSFEGLLGLVRSWSAYVEAKEKGLELLDEETIKEMEKAWGGLELVRSVNYKTYMIAGKVK